MTKMASDPIYIVKNLKKSSPEPEGDNLGTRYVAFGMRCLPSLFK